MKSFDERQISDGRVLTQSQGVTQLSYVATQLTQHTDQTTGEGGQGGGKVTPIIASLVPG